ncbi:MAG: anti-sigma factor [Microbacterium sp.]|uniref:anti-sigma factor n=1 Tax=Microbacterium sp. TaxID=51671 RepID=UPI002721A369|nr:anti-sigma factor [Microbacterium sp.]MDO8383382.1 anti-sigma factor [Microbacterium sp.]
MSHRDPNNESHLDPHLDPEQLALLAMGEPVASDADDAHIAACPDCQHELGELRHAALVGRTAIDAGEMLTPPERVWDAIRDEVGLSAPDAEPGLAAPRTGPAHAAPRRRRGGLATAWVLAASLVVVAGVAVGGWAIGQRTAVVEVAAASLDAFPDHPGAVGAAVLEETPDGTRMVRVELEADQAPDSYREVWLITKDASALVSLGVLDGTEGTFTVPAEIDVSQYVLVDVSNEPDDGQPGHSGDSIVRGELGFL